MKHNDQCIGANPHYFIRDCDVCLYLNMSRGVEHPGMSNNDLFVKHDQLKEVTIP